MTFWTPGNVHNIEYGVAILAFTALEIRFSFLKRFRYYIGDFFGRAIHTLTLFSLTFVLWFWLSLVLFVKFDTNLLLVRSFNFVSNALGTGHWFSWLALTLIITRWGYDNLPAGAIISGFYGALHEGFWYLYYGIANPAQILIAYPFYSPFVFLGGALVVSYVFLSRHGSISEIPRTAIIQMLVLFVLNDTMWLLAGFPVTVSLTTGPTQYFPDLQDNLIEDNSWMVPAIPLIITEREEHE